eukprot:155594-Chlamydomonas_euryale.AAC.2
MWAERRGVRALAWVAGAAAMQAGGGWGGRGGMTWHVDAHVTCATPRHHAAAARGSAYLSRLTLRHLVSRATASATASKWHPMCILQCSSKQVASHASSAPLLSPSPPNNAVAPLANSHLIASCNYHVSRLATHLVCHLATMRTGGGTWQPNSCVLCPFVCVWNYNSGRLSLR